VSGYAASAVTRRQRSGRKTAGNQETPRKRKEKRNVEHFAGRIRYFSPKLAKSGETGHESSSFFPSLVRRARKRNGEANGDGGGEHCGAQTDGRYMYIPEGSIRAARVLTDRTKPRRFRDVD